MRHLTLFLVLLLGATIEARGQVVIETVTVGNPGNVGELSGVGAGGLEATGPDRICGAVDYVYSIATFEITAGQYTEFLNAVAATDTHGLYRTEMADPSIGVGGCNIQRSGSSPNYSYSVAPDWADRPVTYVSWGDAARFANWLHNGQPTGAQDLTTTEDGSYYLNGATTDEALMVVVRESDATWVIPSEDEWYKAAYHYNDGVTGNYWDYPTGSNLVPMTEAPPGTDMIAGSANYYGDYLAIGPPYFRTEVGAYDAKPSDSPYGTFDQGGNVWEWNEAVIDGSSRGTRGGNWATWTARALHAAHRDSHAPAVDRAGGGLRVAHMPLGACCTTEGCAYMTAAGCNELDYAKYNGDGSTCEEACPAGIPTVTSWGLVAMTLLVLSAGAVVLTKRRSASTA